MYNVPYFLFAIQFLYYAYCSRYSLSGLRLFAQTGRLHVADDSPTVPPCALFVVFIFLSPVACPPFLWPYRLCWLSCLLLVQTTKVPSAKHLQLFNTLVFSFFSRWNGHSLADSTGSKESSWWASCWHTSQRLHFWRGFYLRWFGYRCWRAENQHFQQW